MQKLGEGVAGVGEALVTAYVERRSTASAPAAPRKTPSERYQEAFLPHGLGFRLHDPNRSLVHLGMPTRESVVVWIVPRRGSGCRVSVRHRRVGDSEWARPIEKSSSESRPFLIPIEGLRQGETYDVHVTLAGAGETVEYPLRARTAPAATNADPFSFVAASCIQPFDPGGHLRPTVMKRKTTRVLNSLVKRTEAEDRPSFMLGLGDQIYVDDGAHFRARRAMLHGLRSQHRVYPDGEAAAYFETVYRSTFAVGPLDRALARLPAAMMWDDHEIRDGWGSRGDENDMEGGRRKWRLHVETARRFFHEWQGQRNPPSARALANDQPELGETDDLTSLPEFDFSFKWGHLATFFVMDQRSHRSAARGEVVSPRQLERLKAWLDGPAASEPVVFVLGSPLPLCHARPKGILNWLLAHFPPRDDDMRDAWSSEVNRRQRDQILEVLHAHFSKNRLHRLLVLSGDVHFSEVLELSTREEDGRRTVFGHEVVSSGVAQSNYHPFMRRRTQPETAIASRISARGLGRYLGPSFGEIFVSASEGAAPKVDLLFHTAVSEDGQFLADRPKDGERDNLPLGVVHAPPLAWRKPGPGLGIRAKDVVTGLKKDDAIRAVIAEETKVIEGRRGGHVNGDLVGLALSGGGIRSASISLGFLERFVTRGVLKSVDYLSTVSGAGYASGYLFSRVGRHRAERAPNAGDPVGKHLFEDERARAELVRAGRYLAPGRNLLGVFGVLKVIGTVLASTLLNLLWMASFVYFLNQVVAWVVNRLTGCSSHRWIEISLGLGAVGACLLGVHLVSIALTNFRGAISRAIRVFVSAALGLLIAASLTVASVVLAGPAIAKAANGAVATVKDWALNASQAPEAPLGLFVLLSATWVAVAILGAFKSPKERRALWKSVGLVLCGTTLLAGVWYLVVHGTVSPAVRDFIDASGTLASKHRVYASLAIFVALGFLCNANGLSANKLFSDLIAKAFLAIAPGAGPFKRRRQAAIHLAEADTSALPYPLYNTCVNLFDERDPAFAGAKASDYFVLAPLYCGSRLTGYTSTKEGFYASLPLADAIAGSAASVSPLMGSETNSALSVVLNLFNFKLDRWLPNPKNPGLLRWKFWPWFQLRAFLGLLSTNMELVNISDGGFIDNLGVIELLRRRCRVIIAVDNTFDPDYDFKYLRNAVMRARTELGLAIIFREDPEDVIRPSANAGFSRSYYAIADVGTIEGHPQPWSGGVLVYVKATVKAPSHWKDPTNERQGFRYKTYHPHFPQESTAQQFFDEDQWAAHYELGRIMAADVLRIEKPDTLPLKHAPASHSELIARFEEPALESARPARARVPW